MSWCHNCGQHVESHTGRLYCHDCEQILVLVPAATLTPGPELKELLGKDSLSWDDVVEAVKRMADPWISGAPTEPGVYVVWSKIDESFHLIDVWTASITKVVLAGRMSATKTYVVLPLEDYCANRGITHHFRIEPKPPEK